MPPEISDSAASTASLDPRRGDSRSTARSACCAGLLGEPLVHERAAEYAAGFKALADPVRLQLLSLIASAPEGTACSCDLEEPVGKSQPTVSHHLAILAEAGLITKEKVGRWVNCTVVPNRLAELREVLAPTT